MSPETDAGPPYNVPSHMRVKKTALKSPKAKTYARRIKKRRDNAPREGHPFKVPSSEEVLDTPPLARVLFDTPVTVPNDSTIVAAAPMASVVSLIWRIKRLPRMRKVPVKFTNYSHSMVHSGYILDDQEQFLLQGFKEYYATK